MKTSQRELETKLADLGERIEKQIDSYVSNLTDNLKYTIDNIITDFSHDGMGNDDYLSLTPGDLRRIFITGKHALDDDIQAFFSDDIPDSEFSSMGEIYEEMESIAEEMENNLKDDGEEDKIAFYDKLKELAESYQLSDSQYHQDEILRLLEDEIGLKLLVAPAKNQ